MRIPYLPLFCFACLCLPAARAGAQDGFMTPMPETRVSCNDEYTKASDAYRPIVGDILRFDAMFENYAALCGKEDSVQMKALKPFIDSMRERADDDVDDAYRVMTRVIKGILPGQVDAACKNDTGAQDFAALQFHKSMDGQRDKAVNRLKRSANEIDRAQSAQVCHNLAEIKADFEKHTAGKDLSNPLFEIAFLRGMVLPGDPAQNRAYRTYRDILQGMQAERAARKKP